MPHRIPIQVHNSFACDYRRMGRASGNVTRMYTSAPFSYRHRNLTHAISCHQGGQTAPLRAQTQNPRGTAYVTRITGRDLSRLVGYGPIS